MEVLAPMLNLSPEWQKLEETIHTVSLHWNSASPAPFKASVQAPVTYSLACAQGLGTPHLRILSIHVLTVRGFVPGPAYI